MSSGVKAAGLKAFFEAIGTVGSSVTIKGAAAVFAGSEMNTGRCEFGLVGRIEGDNDGGASALGVVPGEGGMVIEVEMEDAECVWWW